jgi:hypothetical protein
MVSGGSAMQIMDQLLSSPGIYPLHIDPRTRVVEFCEMSRDSYRRSPFLDHRIVKASERSRPLAFDDIFSVEGHSQPADTRYIFHSAFCCSTLLSRYLDAIEAALVLREPHSLYEVAILKRFYGTDIIPNVPPSEWKKLFQFIACLLSRRYDASKPVIIKPSDGCNNLMADLLDANPENRGLFIYSSIQRFLVSVLKYEERHEWARIRLRELTIDRQKQGMAVKYDPRLLNSWQTAALVWVYHMEAYSQICQTPCGKKLFALDSEILLDRPVPTLCAILQHFGDHPNSNLIEQALRKPEFNTHSKNSSQLYDEETREREYKKNNLQMQGEIQSGLGWAQEVMGVEHTKAVPPNQLSV